MAHSDRIEARICELAERRELGVGKHSEPRRDTLRARDGRPLLREILGPDGIVRTRLAREVVLDAIRASSGR
jgi:hypothetical protein